MDVRSATSQEALSDACKLVDVHVAEDRRYPNVASQLRVQSDGVTTTSGRDDNDYPSFENQPNFRNLVAMPHVGHVEQIPLPRELVEQFNQSQCSCYMGLFPDIGRAWLSIDSNIYLWNFEDGSDLAYFDGMSEAIFCAGLTRPKPGIFQDHIQYLLCLATTLEIVILGVSFSPTNGNNLGEMHLQQEPLFSLQTNNVHMSSFETTQNGRIFVCSRAGSLYEIMYQSRDGWFTPRCRLVDHSSSKLSYFLPSFFIIANDDPLLQVSVDGSRNILYTRSERGTISVYDLGMDGRGMSRVASLSQDSMARRATLATRTIDENLFKPIIYIKAIETSESPFLNLVAISRAGVRLYFTTSRLQPGAQVNPIARPANFSLVHCRFPPGFSPLTSSSRPSTVHMAFYSQGTSILAFYKSENVDSLLYVHPDSFPFPPSQNVLHESFVPMMVNGRSLAIAEVPTNPYASPVIGQSNDPCLVTQHVKPSRRFVLLSTQGTFTVDQVRPVDQLRHLLIDSQSGKSDAIQAFFQLHKLDQACAMCLILACSTGAINVQVAQWATVAFLHYGGEPEFQLPAAVTQPLAQPVGSPSQGILGGAVISPDLFYSGKHDGLYLYFSRIAFPFWKASLALLGAENQLQSRFGLDELTHFLECFYSLQKFLKRIPDFGNPPPQHDWIQYSSPSQGSSQDVAKKYRAEAFAMEQYSLHNISQLIGKTIEFLSLWKIICEHGFSTVASTMTQEFQDYLRRETFKEIVQRGKLLCNALIQSLMDRFISDSAETGSISARLCNLCPSLFSPDDAIVAKAHETFSKAKTLLNEEKVAALKASLQLFSRVAQRIDLASVTKQFEEVGQYGAVVDLSLAAAKQIDAQDLALHHFKNGQPHNDRTGASALESRKKCYYCVTKCLDNLLAASRTLPQLPAQLLQSQPPATGDAQEKFQSTLQRALLSPDELFHVATYDWLINVGEVDLLVQINSPFLEEYLKREAVEGSQENVTMMNLLWKYYEKNGNFVAASRILCKLAERSGSDTNLQQRIEYLSRAVIAAKSSTRRTSAGNAEEGEFLHDLEEKLEVARIQYLILQALEQSSNPVPPDAIRYLNEDLMDISKLYGDYADHFDLSDCKLAILHSAGYNDPALIENVWRDIINKDLDRSRQSDPPSRMESIRTKLTELGILYFQSERYFPLAFLVRFLEEKSCQLAWNPKWIFTLFRRIGASIPRLYAIYDRLFKSKDPCWQSYGNPLHILQVIYLLLDSFVADPAQVQPYERRSFSSLCLDAVSTYLVELQSMPTTDVRVQQLVAQYESLQKRLQNAFILFLERLEVRTTPKTMVYVFPSNRGDCPYTQTLYCVFLMEMSDGARGAIQNHQHFFRP